MKWITSTETERWSENNRYSHEKGSELVIGDDLGKPLLGFGCCISEICAKAVLDLPEEKKNQVFDALFSEDGCGFNYCRLSIGANDFALSWYSYDETEDDYAMEHFSIDRDRKYILPAIREAQKRSADLEFFASPWSPPVWMKYPKACNYGKLVQTEENMKAYALYFRKFVEAYTKEGVKIAQVCPQNEFFSDQKFPSCVYNAQELENFMANYLIDELKGLTDVWVGTINAPGLDAPMDTHNKYLNLLMQNPKIRQNVKGVAYQWNGKQVVAATQEDYPELDFINSEWQCGDSSNSWDYAMYAYENYHHYFRFGARANVYWNMALEKGGLSTWGWHQNSLVTVENGEYVFTPEFYMVKHFAHFVKKGAVMLSTKGDMSSNSTVFRNPDGSMVAVVLNPFPFEKTLTIGSTNYVLKPRSFNTILL